MTNRNAPLRRDTNKLQTLDRGLRVLAEVSRHDGGLSVAELSDRMDVHRAIVYRLAITLEAHGLIGRKADGRLILGASVLTLASRFEPQLRAAAQPLIDGLAQTTRATAFISVPRGAECVAIMVAEAEQGVLRIGYRVGSRHPLTLGAAGIAILAARPAKFGDPPEVMQARRNGVSITRGHLQPGAVGIASPVGGTAGHDLGFEASIGVVALDDIDIEAATAAVIAHASRLVETVRPSDVTTLT